MKQADLYLCVILFKNYQKESFKVLREFKFALILYYESTLYLRGVKQKMNFEMFWIHILFIVLII